MKTKKLDAAISKAAKRLSPIHPSTYFGDYKYWSGLVEAKKLIEKENR